MKASGKRFSQLPLFWVEQLAWFVVLCALIVWFLSFNGRAPCTNNGKSWFACDPMAFTGFLTVIISIGFSMLVDRDQGSLLSRWRDTAMINPDPKLFERLRSELRRRSRILLVALPLVFVVITIIGYTCIISVFDPFAEFSLASFFCAFLVGLRVAKIISHSFIGRFVEKCDVPFGLTIEHPDRAGGTAQIGRFYFMQASVLAIPVLWLLIWILPLSIPPLNRYEQWDTYFLYLLFGAVIFFVIAFVQPMIAFRRLIRKWKQTYITCEIEQIRADLLALRAIQKPTADQRRRRSDIAHDLDRLMHLPDWPVSLTTRNAFFTTVITFLLPPIINIFVDLFIK